MTDDLERRLRGASVPELDLAALHEALRSPRGR